MHEIPSSYTNWTWFGTKTTKEIAGCMQDKHGADIHWFQHAYCWLYRRLGPEIQNTMPPPSSQNPIGPPSHWVPCLGAGTENGALGFLAVDAVPKFGQLRDTGENDHLRTHAFHAAKLIFDLFRSLDHEVGDPAVKLHFPEGAGSSLSLPVIMAALARILGIVWPDDIVATGCYDAKDGKLKPVAKETLPQKIEVARRFGYKKLVLVEGQNVPANAGIEIVFVNADPLNALFDLLRLVKLEEERTVIGEIRAAQRAEQRVARLLAVFATRKMRQISSAEMDAVVQPFSTSESRLVRHVACNILARAALHEGKTELAYEYDRRAMDLAWNEIPTDWLGHYLRYEETAMRAVLAIDGGVWDKRSPCHIELHERLAVLRAARFRHCADADDMLAVLTLGNARGLRRHFLARLRKNRCILLNSWKDFFYLFVEWGGLFQYCEQIGRRDATPERQRNYMLSVLADALKLGKSLVPYGGGYHALRLIAEHDFVRKDGFDRVAWLDWYFVLKNTPTEEEIDLLFLEADDTYATQRNYPNFLVYEKLLRYGYGTEAQRRHAVEQLSQAAHLNPEPTSILTLLALRTRAVLAQNGKKLDTKPVLPPAKTPLRSIADDLLSDESTLIDRTPY